MKWSFVMLFIVVTVLAACTRGDVYAAMTSTNYEIRNDGFTSGGEDTSSSTNYQLRDSIGGIQTQGGSSTSYGLSSGYRSGIFDPTVDFHVFIQDRSSQVAATALASKTVTVTSAAGMSTGDMIAVIQDEGVNQIAAIGEVVGISGADVTVDFLRYAGVAPTIDGANDVVYVLDGSSLNLGTLSSSLVSTAIIAWESNVASDDGYSVYIYEDDNLASGANVITDVADGAVSAGASEYGGRSSDTTLASSTFDTSDSPFTSTPVQVGSRGASEFKSRDFVTAKASISSSQADGSYAHTLTVIYVGDY